MAFAATARFAPTTSTSSAAASRPRDRTRRNPGLNAHSIVSANFALAADKNSTRVVSVSRRATSPSTAKASSSTTTTGRAPPRRSRRGAVVPASRFLGVG